MFGTFGKAGRLFLYSLFCFVFSITLVHLCHRGQLGLTFIQPVIWTLESRDLYFIYTTNTHSMKHTGVIGADITWCSWPWIKCQNRNETKAQKNEVHAAFVCLNILNVLQEELRDEHENRMKKSCLYNNNNSTVSKAKYTNKTLGFEQKPNLQLMKALQSNDIRLNENVCDESGVTGWWQGAGMWGWYTAASYALGTVSLGGLAVFRPVRGGTGRVRLRRALSPLIWVRERRPGGHEVWLLKIARQRQSEGSCHGRQQTS